MIWDVYEDNNDVYDQIFDMSQDCGLDEKIIFDEYLEDEEETPTVNNEQTDILNDIDSTDALEDANMVDCILKGADMIDYVDNEKHDLQLVYMPATCYLDPFWEGTQRRDLLWVEL